ncbi:MAG: DNA-3-methyladenine glycosylase I [Methanosphaera sp.]|nr:DNA-3-methyladenine glycosylase I [Methanosphaera sp.]
MTQKRCKWAEGKWKEYHDKQWGTPVHDDQTLYENLLLVTFQAGLSWQTMLNKKEHYKKAYDKFQIDKIILYDENKIEELMTNENLIRNRRKIEASIQNTKIFKQIQEEKGSFNNYIWSFTDNKVLVDTTENYQTQSPLSDKISKDLKQRGMKYIGSITIYAYLEQMGIINNHEKTCYKHSTTLSNKKNRIK